MVEVELDARLSARENAARYFEEAKKMRAKAEGVRKAITETEAKIAEEAAKEARRAQEEEKPKIRVKETVEKAWFERFRWFRTSSGFMVLAGKDAKQNEVLAAKHMSKADVYFHADIHGAPTTVLNTEGKEPSEQDLLEAAQFAASFSTAWKQGYGTVDVYCVPASQVSKYSHGEFVPKGGFMITGQRKWFRNTPLGVAIVVDAGTGRLAALPANHAKMPAKRVLLAPGALPREAAGEGIKTRLGVTVDAALALLPPGGFELA